MPVCILNSKQNARFKELRRALAYSGRKTEGLAGVEGPHLVEEAVRAGLRIKCIFAADGLLHHVQKMPLSTDVEVLVMPGEILAGNLSTETPQPVAALVEIPEW